MDLKKRVIITGSTGMVGEGVLYQCLNNSEIDGVLVINRKSCGYNHPKLKEIIHADFFDLSSIESELTNYDACFFCLGISSVGITDETYYKTTYTLTMHVAETLSRLNKRMTFCYVSGGGTDSKEKSRLHWARVKGKTENDLMKLPFEQVFNFRPGFIKPIKGLKFTNKYYKYVSWLYPIGRAIYPNGFCTLEEVGNAMINTLRHQNERKIVEGKDIIVLAKDFN